MMERWNGGIRVIMGPLISGGWAYFMCLLLAALTMGPSAYGDLDEALQRAEQSRDRLENRGNLGGEAEDRLDRVEERLDEIPDRIREGEDARRDREKARMDRERLRKEREKRRKTRKSWKAWVREKAALPPLR